MKCLDKHRGEAEVQFQSIRNLVLRGGGFQQHALATFALVKIQYLLYRRLGGSLSQSGWYVKYSNKLCTVLHSRSAAVNAVLYYIM
jgi:hypothetical protein